MKRWLACLAVGLLATTWVGCQSATEPATTSESTPSGSTAGLTLVSLKVPNMT